MRVARGMFRLWLILSCLWMATVAAIGYSSWPSSTVQQAATSKDPKAYPGPLPEYLKDETLPPEDPNNAFADFPRPGTSRFAEALKDFSAVNAQQSAQQLAVTTAKLALIPPALIFIVGIGLTWAFRGFRHS